MNDEAKSQAEAANWHLAHEWAEGLGLEYSGVDLADTLVYSLLMVLGRVWLAEAAGERV